MKWYKVSWMIKRGGLKMAYCFIQAETAKAAREKFDRIAAKIDSKKKSFGLNPAHRFQIAVKKAAANDVDLSAVWKESGDSE